MKIAFPSKTGRNMLSIYTGILGALYLTFGVMEFLGGIGVLPQLLIDVLFVEGVSLNDIPSGFTLGVIGTVLLHGSRQFKHYEGEQRYRRLSFQFVGLLLSVFFLGLSIIIIGAHWLSAALTGTKYHWLAEVWPDVWLFLLALPGFLLLLRREKE